MKYNLAATDFDDTLYHEATGGISPFTLATIERYKAAGGKFVIVTGRMFASIIQQADALGLKGLIISYQGALISDIETRRVIKSFPLSHDLAQEYIDFLKGFEPGVIQLYADDTLYVEKMNRYAEDYARYCNITAHAVGDFTEFIAANPDKTFHKVYCAQPRIKTPKIMAAAKERFEGRLLINSSAPHNVEAVDLATSKGKALKYLCEDYGIPREEVIAFGDQLNDITLLEYAGFSVAVANANAELKGLADYVCESVSDDGVAKTLIKFCLQEA